MRSSLQALVLVSAFFCKCVWVCIWRGVDEGGEGLLERWKLKIQNGRYFRSTELKQKVCPLFIMTCIAVRALWFALFRCRTKCTHARFPYATTIMAVRITLLWHGKSASFGTIKIKSEHGFLTWTILYTQGLFYWGRKQLQLHNNVVETFLFGCDNQRFGCDYKKVFGVTKQFIWLKTNVLWQQKW